MLDTFIELPRWIYEVGFLLYVLVVTAVVVLERRRPTSTLAWLLVLVFLPVLGLLLYFLVGRRRIQRRIRRRELMGISALDGTRNMANLEALPSGLPDPQRGLVALALRTAAAPLRRADRVELLRTPTAAYEALVSAIDSATHCIHLEFYIWEDDEIGRAITARLTERARAGVKVRVLLDHLGSFGTPARHFAELRAAGGQIASFGRLRLLIRPLRRSRINFRNHRKLVTVDGQLGFVGGINIGEEYLGDDDEERWRDLQIAIEGDAVVGLEAVFVEDWLTSTGEILDMHGDEAPGTNEIDVRKRRHRSVDRNGIDPLAPAPDTPVESEGPMMQIIPSGPDLPLMSSVAAQLTAAVASAQQRCWIATPYFIPDEALNLILRTAALRGVDVRMLVPAARHNDQRLTAYASRSYYDALLASGCRIFEYDGMLHAKYLIADQHVAAIGSANMDVRSFYINYEITAMFYNRSVTADLAAVFEHDLLRANEVTVDARGRLSLSGRFVESFARLLSPLL